MRTGPSTVGRMVWTLAVGIGGWDRKGRGMRLMRSAYRRVEKAEWRPTVGEMKVWWSFLIFAGLGPPVEEPRQVIMRGMSLRTRRGTFHATNCSGRNVRACPGTHPGHIQWVNSLAADRARIAVIGAQILELERSLSCLEEERTLLQDRLDSYTYPVLTLPNEIVSEIFLHFLPVYPATPPMIGHSSPNILGRICRKWREISLSTPALWRGITLSLSNGKRFDQKLRLLKLWLQCSGSCLLSIHMDIEADDMDPSGGAHTNLAATLDLFTHAIAAHSARWEYPIVNGVPNTDSLAQALHAAPLLQDVAVLSWRRGHCTSLYPWSQLTRFTGNSILPHLCTDILARAHNLTYCNMFVYAESADEVTQTAQNVTHRNLSSLILRGYIPDDMPWIFLDIFTLPALRKLEIKQGLLQGDPIGLLKSLISRSRCSIQELYMPYSPEPSLESYRLSWPTVSIVNGPLDSVNPWFVAEDEDEDDDQAMEDSNADSDSD
ncbi:hypothetical protein B0H16DRAFT_1798891 [Mycena metata]|uniref:F-box domain-containing protein n=1 Tax=Mycena metata TaxID=1033252 RepID=A0AAD7HCR3_9AGAR|nr:hypothetical protein B0H16DRAFT_1798891 [Mycena metata]